MPSSDGSAVTSGLLEFAGFIIISAALAAVVHRQNQVDDTKKLSRLSRRSISLTAAEATLASVSLKGADNIAKTAPHKDSLCKDKQMRGKLLEE
jgi:hypothetical protein